MPNKVRIMVQIAGPVKTKVLELNCELVQNDFSEHETAALLFATEFAFNNHAGEIVRGTLNGACWMHVNEMQQR